MRITGKLAAVAAGLCIVAGAHVVQASDAMKAIVGSYLEIHAQLAADKIDGDQGIRQRRSPRGRKDWARRGRPW